METNKKRLSEMTDAEKSAAVVALLPKVFYIHHGQTFWMWDARPKWMAAHATGPVMADVLNDLNATSVYPDHLSSEMYGYSYGVSRYGSNHTIDYWGIVQQGSHPGFWEDGSGKYDLKKDLPDLQHLNGGNRPTARQQTDAFLIINGYMP